MARAFEIRRDQRDGRLSEGEAEEQRARSCGRYGGLSDEQMEDVMKRLFDYEEYEKDEEYEETTLEKIIYGLLSAGIAIATTLLMFGMIR